MGANRLILVAEDSAEEQMLFQRAFDRAEIQTKLEFVSDGEEAVRFLEERWERNQSDQPLPDLVLLDIHMPKRDGFDVLQWLKAHEGLRCLPVTMFTSSSEPGDVNRAYQLGANAYITKPVNAEAYAQIAKELHSYWMHVSCLPTVRPRCRKRHAD